MSMWKFRRSSDREIFGLGAMIGLTCLSIALAAVPRKQANLDDVAVTQGPSEIRVPKEGAPNFDRDIQNLSTLEPHYREILPVAQKARLQGPLERISKKKYTAATATAPTYAHP
jgi:hypothetical protein